MHTFKEYADLVKKEHALNKTIAPNETGTTASRAYAVGEQFIRNGILYKVTTAIASGATWANISSSYEAASNVTAQVTSLKETFAASNIELTQKTTGLIDNQNVNGAVNILPLDLATIKSLNQQWTWSGSSASYKGINITVYDNKIVATGTIAANDYVTLVLVDNAWIESNLKTGQSYKLIGCPSGGSETGYFMQTFRMPSVFDYGDGAEFTFRYTQTGKVIQIAVVGGTSGTTISNVEFRPMLGLASQPDFDYAHGYVPYAKTNRELTEDVADIPYQALTDNGSSEYTLTEGKMWQTKGVTFLYVAVQCNTVSPSSGGTHIKISEIPSKFKKPPLILYPAIAPYRDATTGAGTQLQIATNGQIAIRGGEVGGKYSGLFSY